MTIARQSWAVERLFARHDEMNAPALTPTYIPRSLKSTPSMDSSRAKEYMINGKVIKDVGNREELVKLIRQGAIVAKDKGYRDYYVEVRADHRVNFGAVQGVLKAAAAAGIRGINTKMNITALTD